MTSFRLPDLGEGLSEAEIVTWHVSQGDHVVTDQPLVSVETEKAVVEIPSPQSGRVAKLFGQPGDIVPVGELLVEFDDGSAQTSETVVGELPHEDSMPRVAEPAKTRLDAARVKAAPAVRKLAGELGVNLSALTPSGKGGVLTLADVRAAAGETDPPTRKGEPLRGPRRAMARAMAIAGREVVRATVTAEVQFATWNSRRDIMVLLIRAVVAGCKEAPELNSWFDAEALSLQRHQYVDIGIAMDTSDGLFVPVLRNANQLAEKDIRPALHELRTQVGARTIKPAGLEGATITLSNFGSLGGIFAELVVMPPQVAILGAGRIRKLPGRGAILPLSLSFDHRAVTGGEAMRFLNAIIASLEASGDKS